MDLAPLIVQFHAEADPEARSQILEQIAHADRSSYRSEVVDVLIEALGNDDPVVQEWATVALRKLKGNPEAIRAMWDCYGRDERESVRCCAIVGLAKMNEHLSADRLRALYRERRGNPDDLLLLFAIQSTSKAATDPGVLQALIDIRTDEDKLTPPDPHYQNLTRAAALRCARYCLAANTITKEWLRERHQHSLLDKLGETRIGRLIETHRAKLAQPVLLPELAAAEPDTPLVPGRALADTQDEQYIQDLAEWKNVRIVETRSYVRDQHLARQIKKVVGHACQVCGDQLSASALSRSFVHAHHFQPLSEGGADASKNLVVLCPSCHARLHARELTVHPDSEGVPASVSMRGSEPRPLLRSDAPQDRYAVREQAAYAQVLSLLDRLGPQRLESLLRVLTDRIAGAQRP